MAAGFSVPRVLEQARATRSASTPHEVVYEEDTLQPAPLSPRHPARYAEPVLVCYALVNRPYILDLQPDRSVLRQLLARGFEVYMIDWGEPSAADRSLKLEDYVCRLMKAWSTVVRAMRNRSIIQPAGLLHGRTMSTMFTALYPELVKSLILLAAPIDFGGRTVAAPGLDRREVFDIDALIDTYGNCPAAYLQGCFLLMKPVQNFTSKYAGFYEKMHDDRFVENFFAMEKWSTTTFPSPERRSASS